MKNRLHEKEQLLNAAIANANISRSFEEYLEIFDGFYAEDITATSDPQEKPIRGKANVRGLVFNFLVPLHVLAEVGGLKVTVRTTPIPGDTLDETHSVWTLDLTGAFGATCTLTWSLSRRWRGSRVSASAITTIIKPVGRSHSKISVSRVWRRAHEPRG